MLSSVNKIPRFRVRASGLEEGCTLIAVISTVFIHEGLKSLAARKALGMPEPAIEGKPISELVDVSINNPDELLANAGFLGRRAGLGALWVAQNLPGAPEADADGVFASDAEALSAICRKLGLVEG